MALTDKEKEEFAKLLEKLPIQIPEKEVESQGLALVLLMKALFEETRD